MTRLLVLAEGQTEEAFVTRSLGPHLDSLGVYTSVMTVTTKRDRRTGRKLGHGGGDWTKWQADLRRVMAEDHQKDARFTTLFDLYGLPAGFPGLATHGSLVDTLERVERLEVALAAHFDDPRLIAYLQRHEFEALVLAGLDALGDLVDAEADISGLTRLRAALEGTAPEEVNDGPDTHPSSRLRAAIPGYRKPLHGPLVVERAGLRILRAACPRFDAWVHKLESLAA